MKNLSAEPTHKLYAGLAARLGLPDRGDLPLIPPARITALGFRDEAQAAAAGASDPRRVAPEMTLLDVAALVRPLAQSPALLGVDVTIYNPTRDPDSRYAARIVDWLGQVWAAG